ncbi:hypothetical protein CENDO_08305 [Corynebacterium endometrii]|uniref:Uncharacterized protein n=2 Tax=Corynebacterium endometrii TaxID=2488819 RepID=A0A4P7QGN1_9CORY|nr:hypothetical protein CENDO_08305 [Corynebacterium endometrii]
MGISTSVLELLGVDCEAFFEVCTENFGCPFTELCTVGAANPVPDGEDSVEIVVFGSTSDCSALFNGNIFQFGNSCFSG